MEYQDIRLYKFFLIKISVGLVYSSIVKQTNTIKQKQQQKEHRKQKTKQTKNKTKNNSDITTIK